jgi:hypothetical protein
MASTGGEELYDVTARRFHQAGLVVLLLLGFLLGAQLGRWLVLAVALIMLIGRYWEPFDIFRLLAWKVLEPAGILRPHLAPEDRAGRRTARVLGGIALLLATVLLSTGQVLVGWMIVWLIGIMIALDAAFSLCLWCYTTYQLGRLGLLPAARRHS